MKTLLIVVAVAAGGYYFWLQRPLSAQEQAFYGKQCSDWISAEYADGAPATIISADRRRGKLVFIIGTPRGEGTSQELTPCIIDTSAGTMIKPSLLDQSWR